MKGTTILVATGLHRSATADEIRAIVGPEIASCYRVVNHDARALTEHRSLGKTRSGTPVYIDERFMAADLHITLGLIEQHLMLGFSGGRKLIAPGLAAEESIKVIHSPRFMREPMATEGSVNENPLHEELLEIARMARHDFILDVALTRSREIAGVFAGNPVIAHAAGVSFIKNAFIFFVTPLFGTVILGMLWKRATGPGAFWGLFTGIGSSIAMWAWVQVHSSALKILALSNDAQPMAENLYRMLWSWLACVAVTVGVSLFTRPEPVESLSGLVYGCTEIPGQKKYPLVQQPVFWAIAAALVFLWLQWLFR